MKCRPLSRLFRVAVPFMVVGLAIVLARAGLLAQIGPPTVSIAASATAWENDGKVTVSVMLTSPASQTVTVHYATANGSPPGPAATAPADYADTSKDLTLAPGEMMQSITIPIVNDGIPDSGEKFVITLTSCTGANLGNTTCEVTIFDMGGGGGGGATVQFASASYMVSEGGGSAVIGLSLTGSSSQPVTVTYAVADGTAKANADYQAITPGTLTFAAGETSKSFTVTILQDSESEGSETVALSLSNPINATLGIPSSAILTIMDDETPPQAPTVQFSSGTYSVVEGGATATITVTLSTAATGPVSVQYATADGFSSPATAGDDYTATSGTLNFAAGDTTKTFSVPILQDSTYEGSETVKLSLSNPSGATLGIPSTATLTITDDDPPPPLNVTATSGSASPNPVPVNIESTASVSAMVNNPPSAPPPCTLKAPQWSWSYDVQYAAAPGEWGAPPQGAVADVTFDTPPSTNPSFTTMRIKCNVAGYWKIIKLKASVVYTDSCGNSWSGFGFASDVTLTVVSATIAPDPIYVTRGGTAPATVTVFPAGAASSVMVSTADSSVATSMGSPPNVTITGATQASSNTTQLLAKLSSWTLATADINLVGLSYSPTSGEVLTEVFFSTDTPASGLLSSATTIQIDATFTPSGYGSESFSVTHAGVKVRFDPAYPGQASISVADVFPSTFLSSTNPGLKMALVGTVQGTVTITNGTMTGNLPVQFTILQSAQIGRITDGSFEPVLNRSIWTANSASDFADLPPEIFLYAQVTRPVNSFTSNPPAVISVLVRSFAVDGTPVSDGVSMSLSLVMANDSSYVYQSQQPFVLIDNPALEGTYGNVIAIASADGCSAQVVRLPP